jgi:hypothetical protein
MEMGNCGGDCNRDRTDLMTEQLDDDNDDRQNSKRVLLNVCYAQKQDHGSCHGAGGFPTKEPAMSPMLHIHSATTDAASC